VRQPGNEVQSPRSQARPVVVLSRCLELEPVRYNQQVIPFSLVTALQPHVTFVPVCPEVEIGLGVPREPIRIALVKGEPRLLQPATGRDVTAEMDDFSARFLATTGEVDGFILKSRSPSCGTKEVKVYASPEPGAAGVAKRAGLFAAAVQERHPGLAIEDEGRLLNYEIREYFLTRIFAFAELRRVRASGAMAELVRFHAEHKLILLAYHQGQMRALGRIVANAEKRPFAEVVTAYQEGFRHALGRPARHVANINVLMHALGYVSDGLSGNEKAFFLDMLERYRARRLPLSSLLSVLRSWILRFEVGYLAQQRYLQPFPEELQSLSDSGKGRPV